MKQSRRVAIEAVCDAAQTFRRPDGKYQRRELRELAYANDMAESTLRRHLYRRTPTGDLATGSSERSAVPSVARRSGLNVDRMLLCLSLAPDNMKVAHQIAQQEMGYPNSYVTFTRDVHRLPSDLVAYAKGGKEALLEHLLYLSGKAPHRNHMWQLDSTMADLRVRADRGFREWRPWITVIVDSCTGVIQTMLAHEGDPTAEVVVTTIASAVSGGDWELTGAPFTGGLPIGITVDNGAANLAAGVAQGCRQFGIVLSPTQPRSAWQNGSVERVHRTLKEQLLIRLPGYSKGGTQINGDPRFGPKFAGKGVPRGTGPAGLLTMSQFRWILEEWRLRYNETCIGADGLTPNERFLADSTALRPATEHQILAHMTVQDRVLTRQKQGIRFRGAYYTAPSLSAVNLGGGVRIRHLPTVRSWIEAFTEDGTYIARLYRIESLSEAQKVEVLTERARIHKKVAQIDAVSKQYRRHMTLIEGELMDGEEVPAPASIVEHAAEGFTQPVSAPQLPVAPPHTPRGKSSSGGSTDPTQDTKPNKAGKTLGERAGITLTRQELT